MVCREVPRVNECDVVALIGFLIGVIAAGVIAATLMTGQVATTIGLSAITPLAIYYISRRKEWFRKLDEYGTKLKELDSIKAKIKQMLKDS